MSAAESYDVVVVGSGAAGAMAAALRQGGRVKKHIPNSQESAFRPKALVCRGAILLSRQLQHLHFCSNFRAFGPNDGPADHDGSSNELVG